MPREPDPLTLSAVVRRAAEVVDPEGEDSAVGALERHFEDADEPITAIDALELRLATAAEEVDVEDPAVSMAVATVLYLAHRRDELDAPADDVLRLAARAEWKADPPDAVAGRGGLTLDPPMLEVVRRCASVMGRDGVASGADPVPGRLTRAT
jgi:hypothetical protein